ncbi:MAG: hypothetical protein ACC618_02005 [Patescibacteria group bacterium]
MKKKVTLFLFLAVIFISPVQPVSADVPVVTESASVRREKVESGYDYRVNLLETYFKGYNSPLADHAKHFIYFADKYGLDWRLVPAISGVESTFGKNIPTGSYNAYGWANGSYYFESWLNSIEIVSKTLREKYIDRGANTLPKIARRYAASPTWERKVRFFMNEIDRVPLAFTI